MLEGNGNNNGGGVQIALKHPLDSECREVDGLPAMRILDPIREGQTPHEGVTGEQRMFS